MSYRITLTLTDAEMERILRDEYFRSATPQAIRSCGAAILRDYGAVTSFVYDGVTDLTKTVTDDDDEYTAQRNAGLTEGCDPDCGRMR